MNGVEIRYDGSGNPYIPSQPQKPLTPEQEMVLSQTFPNLKALRDYCSQPSVRKILDSMDGGFYVHKVLVEDNGVKRQRRGKVDLNILKLFETEEGV